MNRLDKRVNSYAMIGGILGLGTGIALGVLASRTGTWGMMLAYTPALGCGFGVATGAMIAVFREDRSRGVCPKCKYPTEGLREERCPECGTPLSR